MLELGRGALSKMSIQLGDQAQYSFRLNDTLVPVNPLIGKTIRLEYLGAIPLWKDWRGSSGLPRKMKMNCKGGCSTT